MKKSLLDTLQQTIQGTILKNIEYRRLYSVDASSYQIVPKVVIIPKNEDDVINTIKCARKFKTSVTVRGAGTGLVGGALNRGIILDMKNFDSCIIKKNYAIVGSGVLKGTLDKKLEKIGKFFPPNPSIGSFCSIGGMLGNNSSGSRSLKYGSVIDNVSEITFIDGNGKKNIFPEDNTVTKKILKITKEIDRSKFPNVTKNSSGYRVDKISSREDIHKLIIGSEGTLGIITSAKLKIKNKPKNKILFVIGYESIKVALKNCAEIKKLEPSAIEFVDKTTFRQIKYSFTNNLKCLLFVEFDEEIEINQKKVHKTIKGKIIRRLKKESEISKWWKYRDSALHYSLKSIKKQKRIPHIIEDAAVPIEKLPKKFTILNKINKKYKTKSIAYGHAGNGNIHIRLSSNKISQKKIMKISREYFEEIIKMKGTITAEHGDGLARSEFIKNQYGVKNYQIFIKIKELFDPKKILNPGKIISNENTMLLNLKEV